MRKKKNIMRENGITLVALVVTIIILLILAGTTIGTIFGENGIVQMAQKVKEETEKAVEESEGQMQELMNELSNTTGGNTTGGNTNQNNTTGGEEVTPGEPTDWEEKPDGTISNNVTTLKVGDYVSYNCKVPNSTYTSTSSKNGYGTQTFNANDYEYGWRVLGIDNNHRIKLISEDLVPLTGGYNYLNRNYYYLGSESGNGGQTAYVNAKEELNNICKIYGKGEGAIEAKCLNADDINKITGYNPNDIGRRSYGQSTVGKKYGEGTLGEYGNIVTCKFSYSQYFSSTSFSSTNR